MENPEGKDVGCGTPGQVAKVRLQDNHPEHDLKKDRSEDHTPENPPAILRREYRDSNDCQDSGEPNGPAQWKISLWTGVLGNGKLSSGTEGLAHFLTGPLAGQCLFEPFSFPGFQIEGVLLDVLDDVFLLDLALESTQGTLNRLPILNSHICQSEQHRLSEQHKNRDYSTKCLVLLEGSTYSTRELRKASSASWPLSPRMSTLSGLV